MNETGKSLLISIELCTNTILFVKEREFYNETSLQYKQYFVHLEFLILRKYPYYIRLTVSRYITK